jgi:hypothetical protein
MDSVVGPLELVHNPATVALLGTKVQAEDLAKQIIFNALNFTPLLAYCFNDTWFFFFGLLRFVLSPPIFFVPI